MSPSNEDAEAGSEEFRRSSERGDGTTLEQFLAEQETPASQSPGLSDLLQDLATAARNVSRMLRTAGITDVLGRTGTVNVQGEVQQKMDALAHREFEQALRRGGRCCLLGSEEHADVIHLGSSEQEVGPYIVLIDPLDGSANIDVGVSVGTIFSIYVLPDDEDGKEAQRDAVLQPGTQQVAAGYVLYGSSTILMYTAGSGVHGFTLKPSDETFVLSHPNVRMPETGRVVAINAGGYDAFQERVQNYVMQVLEENRPTRTWYIGCLVSDFHRNLLKGGVYIYPITTREPAGKLRLMYEANPMAYLAEEAGGRATDGESRILEASPEGLHDRIPLFIGSERLVRRAEAFLRDEAASDSGVDLQD